MTLPPRRLPTVGRDFYVGCIHRFVHDGRRTRGRALLAFRESERRERERARFEKAVRSKRNKRGPRCPGCKVPLVLDGRRHDGAASHNGIVKGLSLRDNWVKFVAGEPEYERKMKLMNNCCSYLRHCFESHNGIKFSKLEACGNFFMYRWCHVRKHGFRATVEFLFTRVFGTDKHLIQECGF